MAVQAGAPVRRRGRPPHTEKQKATKRARIVDGVIEAIRTGGPDLSLEEMAAAAGVSKPVLYDEFGGKLGLADAIAVVLADQVQATVVQHLLTAGTFDISHAVRAVVDALITLIDDEPQLYAFIVRSIRSSDRGFLDNALVRVIHERASMLVNVVAPGVEPDALRVLTDGVFGFVFAAVESWMTTRLPARDELVDTLALVIREGLRAAAGQLDP
jgi:AcrR family transcriptional regulator